MKLPAEDYWQTARVTTDSGPHRTVGICLEPDDFIFESSSALALALSMILSENRSPLFGIML